MPAEWLQNGLELLAFSASTSLLLPTALLWSSHHQMALILQAGLCRLSTPQLLLLLSWSPSLQNGFNPAGRSTSGEERRQSPAWRFKNAWRWRHPRLQLPKITAYALGKNRLTAAEEKTKHWSPVCRLNIDSFAAVFTWMKRLCKHNFAYVTLDPTLYLL